MTLRNTSTLHLQDVEIQFEFPADDVQAWASRPALSKTALLRVDAFATEPWKAAFRWRIPRLPSGDSVEFTFTAVSPPTQDYETALYGVDRVVLDRVVGEPLARKRRVADWWGILWLVVLFGFVLNVGAHLLELGNEGFHYTEVAEAGCDLLVDSSYENLGQSRLLLWRTGPWEIHYRVSNVGNQTCFINSELFPSSGPNEIARGQRLERQELVASRPREQTVNLMIGATKDSQSHKALVQTFGE